MGKTQTFKDRPKPPTKEQILADLSSAQETDVVFHTHFAEQVAAIPNVKEDPANSERSEETNKTDPALVNFTYEKVRQLVHLHNQLTYEPQKLNEQYQQLEKLGEEVSLSIEELRAAAEHVMSKTKK
ncbi:UPF0449 protein C19orf25 homolog [Dreissena polymorpha]|uniref:UPF0449 protein C19orf25 homolog n=1 Tax=Dreissena polymorpha TaxID=45954 RepID=UPI002264F616|nr:UPF0449 protein C19orf25 homolog [Dreissena polymorpha]